ncbi:MAG: glycosyltransferase family 4 protein [Tsuneonella sp.]
MAHFLFVLPRFHTNALPWVRILQQAGHRVTIHAVRVGPTEDHSTVQPVVLERSRMAGLAKKVLPRKADPDFYAAPSIASYARTLRRLAPDVVIVRGVSRWACRVAAIAALLHGRKLVIYDQDLANPRPWSGTWLRRAAFELCGVPHFTARRPAGAEPRNFGSARTIPFGARNPSDNMIEEARRRQGSEPVVPRIMMVGKYRPRKGHAVLLAALGPLAERYDFELTFCGEESDASDIEFRRDLEETAGRLGLASRTQFKANLASEDMLAEYAGHHIFVLPSLNEPAAVSPIEAVWSGCAAIVDIHSGTRGYLPAKDDYAVDARASNELAAHLEAWLASPAKLKSARRECLECLAECSSDQIILQRFTELAHKA